MAQSVDWDAESISELSSLDSISLDELYQPAAEPLSAEPLSAEPLSAESLSAEPSHASHPQPAPASNRRPRQTEKQKLEKHLKNLQEDGLTVVKFLDMLSQSKRIEWRNLRDRLYNETYERLLKDLLHGKEREILDMSSGWGILEDELERLAKGAVFGPWKNGSQSDLNQMLNFNKQDYVKEAESLSPYMCRLIRQLLKRRHDTKANDSTLIGILSHISYARAPRTSNNLPTAIGLCIHGGGVQARTIDLCHKIGLCEGYKTILRVSKEVSGVHQEVVRDIGSTPTSVTAYDNFEQTFGVKGQRLDDNSEFHSVTTGEVLHGREMPPSGLTQSMLYPSISLKAPHLVRGPGMELDLPRKQVRCCCYLLKTSFINYLCIGRPVFRLRSSKGCISLRDWKIVCKAKRDNSC